tara:strand:+ start:1366 stop:1509 length:144 start_codon:yes stop_codon:yes gene_type:complete
LTEVKPLKLEKRLKTNIDYTLMELNIDRNCNGEAGIVKFKFSLQHSE